MRYEFTCFETDAYGKENGNKISTSFHADTLNTMLERFEHFLRGSGFYFTGTVDIVGEDDTSKINFDEGISINLGGGSDSPEHSPYYYDYDRNKSFNLDVGMAQDTYNINLDDQDIMFTSLGNIDISNNFSIGDTMIGNPNER